ncbi:DUF4811 domain-containing protein [Lacticaseibacillus zhaodongensis]|uniref:DUF4811 domain-containing protein n=1 Tax=Lacticaseibacillus zhaodongensis TaxID=2668065 RepID=UPI0012D2B74B|nr:DUF4811 domain-containing protein [Lacticaseibacillus zhaodongensis]
MIIALVIITLLAFYLAFIMMKPGALRTTLWVIFGICFLGSLAVLYGNYAHHFGMEKRTETSEQVIYSASPNKQLPMLLKQDIGTSGKHQVYIYKTSDKSKAKATHTKADYDVHNQVQTTSRDTATITSKRVVWRYKSGFYKSLFSNQNNGKLVRQTNTIKVPKTWVQLSTTQAKALGKKLSGMKNPSAAQKKQMGAAIQQAVMAARQKNPQMTPAQMQAVEKQATAKIQQQVIQQAIKEVKSSVK